MKAIDYIDKKTNKTMKTYIKNKTAFLVVYEKFLSELVFWREIGNGKVEIKIAMPKYAKHCKQILSLIP